MSSDPAVTTNNSYLFPLKSNISYTVPVEYLPITGVSSLSPPLPYFSGPVDLPSLSTVIILISILSAVLTILQTHRTSALGETSPSWYYALILQRAWGFKRSSHIPFVTCASYAIPINYVKVWAPNLLVRSSRMSEPLLHPESQTPFTYVASAQESLRMVMLVCWGILVGQGL